MTNGLDFKRDLKEHGVTVSVSTVVTIIPLFGMIWFLVKPVIIDDVSTVLNEQIHDRVKEGVRPINEAFKTLLRADINRLRKEIAALKFIRNSRPDDWTEEQASLLAEKEIELDAMRTALEDLS